MEILPGFLFFFAACAFSVSGVAADANKEMRDLIARSARASADCKAGNRVMDLEGTDVFPVNGVYKDEAQLKRVLGKAEDFGRKQPPALRELVMKLQSHEASKLKSDTVLAGVAEVQRCPRLSYFSVMSNLVRSAGGQSPSLRKRIGAVALDFSSGKSFAALMPVETLWQAVLLDQAVEAGIVTGEARLKTSVKQELQQAKLSHARAGRRGEESRGNASDKAAGELFLKQSDDMRLVREELANLAARLRLPGAGSLR